MTCKRIFLLAFCAAAGGGLGLMAIAIAARFVTLLLQDPRF